MKKFSKIFMIFCVLFSQFSGVIEVFAEEIEDNTNEEIVEESVITATLDDDYNLVIKSNGSLNAESNYDVYLTSSYKYAYDSSEVKGYTDVKINEEESILGSVFNGEEGYSVLVDSIETKYNGVYTLSIEVVDIVLEESYSTTITKEINQEDNIEVLANGVSIESDIYEVGEDKEVQFTYNLELSSTLPTVVSSVSVNDTLLDGNYIVDYEGMLYGTYSYDWNVLVDEEVYTSRNISVEYNSEDNVVANAEILTNANTLVDEAGNKIVKFASENVYLTNGVSIEEFIGSISMEAYDVKVISLVDSIETEVETGNVENGMSLVISRDGLVLTYTIVIVGDVDSDGDTDQDDVVTMVESILADENSEEEYYSDSADVNVDGVVDIFDVTKTIDALSNGWNNQVVIDGENLLDPVINSDVIDEVKIGDTITVRFALNNFNESVINGLSGKIEYDNNILSLDEVLVSGMEMYYNENGEFIVFGEDYNSEEDFIQVTFTAIGASEEEYVSISNLIASYAGEEVLLSVDSVSIAFKTTYTSNVGGDVEEEINTTLVGKEVATNARVLSSDSYLLSLDVKGYEIDFSPYTFKYNIKVGNDVTSLSIDAILSDYRATYAVYGNENFKVGENIVTLVVTAEDGNTHTYTLIVEKEEDKEVVKEDKNDDEEQKEESNASRTVIIVLIILVIIGLIYLIFKDDEEDKEKKD